MPTKKRTTKKTVAKKRSSIVDRIISLDDIPDDGIKMCIYGMSGTGKTRFMSTFSSSGRLLHVICSSNKVNEARSIKGAKNIDIVELTDPNELEDLVEYGRQGKYTTISFDHVTDFCGMVLAKIVGLEKMPEQNSWGLASQDNYQRMGLQVKTYLRDLMDLECNVLFLAQERSFKTEAEADDIVWPYVGPSVPPTVSNWLTYVSDYVAQTFKRKKCITVKKKVGKKTVLVKKQTDEYEYCLRVGPDGTFQTKFRVPIGTELPSVIADPTYDKLKHLFGE